MTHEPRGVTTDGLADPGTWTRPSVDILLGVSGALWLMWCVGSMIVAPIVLAARRDQPDLADEKVLWGEGL